MNLLKEFIIENANECELFPLEGGYKRLIGEKPKNYDEVIDAEIYGDILKKDIPEFIYKLSLELEDKNMNFSTYLEKNEESFKKIFEEFKC